MVDLYSLQVHVTVILLHLTQTHDGEDLFEVAARLHCHLDQEFAEPLLAAGEHPLVQLLVQGGQIKSPLGKLLLLKGDSKQFADQLLVSDNIDEGR